MDTDMPERINGTSDINLQINQTDAMPPYWPLGFRVVLSIMLSVFMFFAIFGNLLVVVVIAKYRGMQTRTNMFLCNLAVADILAGVFDMPITLITLVQGEWIFPDWVCQLNGFTLPLFFVASIHTLMYISIHKYMSIAHPFSLMLTRKRVFFIICAAWFWALLSGYLTIHGLNRVYYKPYTTQCGPEYPHDLRTYVHVVFILGLSFFVPLFVITFCYIGIFTELKAHAVRMTRNTTMSRSSIYNQQRRITSTLLAVLVVFIVSWTPYISYSIYVSTASDLADRVPRRANPISYIFIYLNSAFNPLIYAKGSASFREGFKQILCFWRWKRTTTESELSTSGAFTRFRLYLREALNATFLGSEDTNGPQDAIRKRSLASLANGVLFSKPRSLSTFSLPHNFQFSVHLSNGKSPRKRKNPLRSLILCNCLRRRNGCNIEEITLPVAQDCPGTVYYPETNDLRPQNNGAGKGIEGKDDKQKLKREFQGLASDRHSNLENTNRCAATHCQNGNLNGQTCPPPALSPSDILQTDPSLHIESSDPLEQNFQGNAKVQSDFQRISVNNFRDDTEANTISEDMTKMIHVKSDTGLELQNRKSSVVNKEKKQQRFSLRKQITKHVFRSSVVEHKTNGNSTHSSSKLLQSNTDSRNSGKIDTLSCIFPEEPTIALNPRHVRRRTVTGKLTRCPSVERLDACRFRLRSNTVCTNKHNNRTSNRTFENLAAERKVVELTSLVNETKVYKGKEKNKIRRHPLVRSGSDPCITFQMLEEKFINRRQTRNWHRQSREKHGRLSYDLDRQENSLLLSGSSPMGTDSNKSGHSHQTNELDIYRSTPFADNRVGMAGVPCEVHIETTIPFHRSLSFLDTDTCIDTSETKRLESNLPDSCTTALSSEIQLEQKNCLPTFAIASTVEEHADEGYVNNIGMENKPQPHRQMIRTKSDKAGCLSDEPTKRGNCAATTKPMIPLRLSEIPEDPHKRLTFTEVDIDDEGSDRETTLSSISACNDC